jgi:L-iditol 2-dehydrogenase
MMAAATMKALRLYAVGDLRLEDVPIPRPGPGEVRVKVAFCGVCGSDIPRCFVKGTYHFPTVCGHEFAGTVDALGEGVESLAPGQPVTVFPLLWCGTCPACEQGQYAQCFAYDYLGSRSDGAWAEYVVAPVANLLPVPDGVSLEEAAMTEPAAVALHAVRRGGGAAVGETAVVFGAGPIGLIVGQWARAGGAAQVLLFDIDPHKLALAAKLGFTQTFDAREHDAVATVNELTGGKGAHLCIEAAGVPVTMCQAIACARWNGRVVLMGNPSADVTLPARLISQAMRREIAMLGTWNSVYSATGNDDDWRTALDAMADGRLTLAPLITHSVPLSGATAALEMMRDRSEFSAKVLVAPAR